MSARERAARDGRERRKCVPSQRNAPMAFHYVLRNALYQTVLRPTFLVSESKFLESFQQITYELLLSADS